MKVLKFGGTSVGSAESLRAVKGIIADYQAQQSRIAVVVSALKGTTNALIEAGELACQQDERYREVFANIEAHHLTVVRELVRANTQSKVIANLKITLNELEELLQGIYLLRELSARTHDSLSSFGERLSAFLIAHYLQQEGIDAAFLDARNLIRTDNHFGKARVNFEETNARIQSFFQRNKQVQIITGFIASSPTGETTTLGRGGSDYTAAIFGAALKAKEVEIWTDVDGVLTADPRIVANAFSLEAISYEEAMEISHFGAKVIYPPTLQPAFNGNIPLRIRNTFNVGFPGTLISRESAETAHPIKGVSSIKSVAMINLSGSGLVGVPGVSSRLFGALSREQVSVILITQASSEHSISFAIAPEDVAKAKKAIEQEFDKEMERGRVNPLDILEEVSVVAIIGENMKKAPGISGALFTALGKNGINTMAIAQGSSELNISLVVRRKDLSKTLNVLHDAFFLSEKSRVHIFLMGVGLIGGTLLAQIQQQQQYLYEQYNIDLKVVGLANTKKMVFNADGLDLGQGKDGLLALGEGSNVALFIKKMKKMNLSNSVFADCTAGSDAVGHYANILDSSISITTPNKIGNSGTLAQYRHFQRVASRRGIKFMYETNVGAGLPVIGPLQDLKKSGDRILKIEGVLSGTLSYIFNEFKPGKKFADIVKTAKEKGFTEPDPRDDLNGMDVARKILILAREAGLPLEPADVTVENILPTACMEAKTTDAFLEELEKADDVFAKRLDTATKNGKVLRFIATLQGRDIQVGLKEVDQSSPFFALAGSDNMVVFTTDRYKSTPLVIKGPGAGADVTAAGVFAEIIAIGNYLTHYTNDFSF